jgi:hypothetical protein
MKHICTQPEITKLVRKEDERNVWGPQPGEWVAVRGSCAGNGATVRHPGNVQNQQVSTPHITFFTFLSWIILCQVGTF